MKIYVASSWRNPFQAAVVTKLRELGHDVYDFKNPPNRSGFSWRQLGGDAPPWTPAIYRERLQHPVAQAGFASDMDALKAADACLLVMPCGASAHLELGWSIGAGKRTAVYYPDGIGDFEPELMALAADSILIGEHELVHWAGPVAVAPVRVPGMINPNNGFYYTGVAATGEQEQCMREARTTPFMIIGGHTPPSFEEVMHAYALQNGLPEIQGHYGYDFGAHEFIRMVDADKGEPDRWPSHKLSDILNRLRLKN